MLFRSAAFVQTIGPERWHIRVRVGRFVRDFVEAGPLMSRPKSADAGPCGGTALAPRKGLQDEPETQKILVVGFGAGFRSFQWGQSGRGQGLPTVPSLHAGHDAIGAGPNREQQLDLSVLGCVAEL